MRVQSVFAVPMLLFPVDGRSPDPKNPLLRRHPDRVNLARAATCESLTPDRARHRGQADASQNDSSKGTCPLPGPVAAAGGATPAHPASPRATAPQHPGRRRRRGRFRQERGTRIFVSPAEPVRAASFPRAVSLALAGKLEMRGLAHTSHVSLEGDAGWLVFSQHWSVDRPRPRALPAETVVRRVGGSARHEDHRVDVKPSLAACDRLV